MNIVYFLKAFLSESKEFVIFFVLFWVQILCFFLVFPFCKKENTIDAEKIWFAWHPVVLEASSGVKISNIRWFTRVKRWHSWDGMPYYYSIEESTNG